METYEYTPPAKESPKKDAPDSKPTDQLIKPSQQHMTDLGLDAAGKTELAKQLAKMRARSIPTGYPEEKKSKSILEWFDRDLIIKIIIVGVTAFVAYAVTKYLAVPLLETLIYTQTGVHQVIQVVGIQEPIATILALLPPIVFIWVIVSHLRKDRRYYMD